MLLPRQSANQYRLVKEGLGRKFRIHIWIGFGLVGATFLASIIAIYGGCRPLEKYWQINPNPGSTLQFPPLSLHGDVPDMICV